jgi:CRISPR/Cas system-associated endoribonuclease Cas2
MALYVVTYDERAKPGHNYKPLYDLLNSWKAAHLQNSVWLASINGKAIDVVNAMLTHMHADDTAAAIEIKVGSDWATRGVRPEGTAWLKTNVLA